MIKTTLLLLTLNVYHESRGEPQIAQKGVVHVVMNRTKENNTSINHELVALNQFSWRLDRSKLDARPWYTDSQAFIDCGLNVVRALNSKDITHGATHFHTKGKRPYWAKKMKKTTTLGKLVFYKETNKNATKSR